MKLLIIILAILISGCTTYWKHPEKNEQAFDADLHRCETDAAPIQNVYRNQDFVERCLRMKQWKRSGIGL